MTQAVDDMSVKYVRGLVDATASIPHTAAEEIAQLADAFCTGDT
jgi:hypothetical protein